MQVPSWVGTIPWRRAWKHTPVFLPGKSMDTGAWRATVHRVAKSWTHPKQVSTAQHTIRLKMDAFSCMPSWSQWWWKWRVYCLGAHKKKEHSLMDLESKLMVNKGEVGRDKLGVCYWHIYTTICKNNQQGPTL